MEVAIMNNRCNLLRYAFEDLARALPILFCYFQSLFVIDKGNFHPAYRTLTPISLPPCHEYVVRLLGNIK